MESRRARLRCIHSMESAYTFGVAISTVAGRFKITFRQALVATHRSPRRRSQGRIPIRCRCRTRGVLEVDLGLTLHLVGEFLTQLSSVDRNIGDAGFIETEDHATLKVDVEL